MDLSLFLAQFLGILYSVLGLAVIMRRDVMRHMAYRLSERPVVMFVLGLVTFMLGLFLVLIHSVWTTFWQGLISVLAWATMIKGLVYIFLPGDSAARIVGAFDRGAWYTPAGILVLALGLYLTAVGFGVV